MRLYTSLLLVSASFSIGFFLRPKLAPAAPEQITFISRAPKASPQSAIVAGRSPQSVGPVAQEAGLIRPIRETINGVDIVQAMLAKDMAKVYAANKIYEQAWRRQFIESHAKPARGTELDKLESALVRSLPVRKGEGEKIYRGKTTLQVEGEAVYIDVVMSMTLHSWKQTDGQAESEFDRPCFRLDGFIATEKIVERLSFDQSEICAKNMYERMEAGFIGVDNYRRKTGSLVNMLLFPVNPNDKLPMEYLIANSADWQKDGQWTWEQAGPEALEALQNSMVARAIAAGMDPGPLYVLE